METISIKSLISIIFSILLISCSSNSDDNDSNSNESRIDVTINGTNYSFNTFTLEKHFEDPNDSYYYVIAKIDNEPDLYLDFGVQKLGVTGNWQEGEIIDEFNLYVNCIPGETCCIYYGVDIPHPQINVTVNNEQELKATFSFTNNYDASCVPTDQNGPFGNRVTYTNGAIYLKL